MIPVAEFASAEDLRAHYSAVLGRAVARDRAAAARLAGQRAAEDARRRTQQEWRAEQARRVDEELRDAAPQVHATLGVRARSFRRIIAEVEARHGLSAGDIPGPGRTARVVAARFEAIAEVRAAYPDKSLPWLGRVFNRDHTTILHALRKMGLWP